MCWRRCAAAPLPPTHPTLTLISRLPRSEVGKDFGGSAAGRAVLQAAFTQLLLHYNRFLELCKRQVGTGGARRHAAGGLGGQLALQPALPSATWRPMTPHSCRAPTPHLQGAAGLGGAQQAVTLPSIMYFIKQYSR